MPNPVPTRTMAGILRSRLSGGSSVVVHCHAGIGRSSTLAAAVLVYEGTTPGEAWDLIAAARGMAVPDTPAQREFIERLAGVQPAAYPYPPS